MKGVDRLENTKGEGIIRMWGIDREYEPSSCGHGAMPTLNLWGSVLPICQTGVKGPYIVRHGESALIRKGFPDRYQS